VESLKACHRECDQGHFASTEYAVLTVELEKQHTRILNSEEPAELASPKLFMSAVDFDDSDLFECSEPLPLDTSTREEREVPVPLPRSPSRRLSRRWTAPRSRAGSEQDRHSDSNACDGSGIIGSSMFDIEDLILESHEDSIGLSWW
jgi:hypothetical protein